MGGEGRCKGRAIRKGEQKETRQSERERRGGGGGYFVDLIAVEAIFAVCARSNLPSQDISCRGSFITVRSGAAGGGDAGRGPRGSSPGRGGTVL